MHAPSLKSAGSFCFWRANWDGGMQVSWTKAETKKVTKTKECKTQAAMASVLGEIRHWGQRLKYLDPLCRPGLAYNSIDDCIGLLGFARLPIYGLTCKIICYPIVCCPTACCLIVCCLSLSSSQFVSWLARLFVVPTVALAASHDRGGLFVGGMWCGHHRTSIRVIALITHQPGPCETCTAGG